MSDLKARIAEIITWGPSGSEWEWEEHPMELADEILKEV